MKLNSTIALGIIGAITALIIYSIHLTTVKWPAEQARNQHAYEQAASAPENLLLICPPSHDGKPVAPEQCKRSGQYKHDRRQQMADHRAQISMKYAAWWTVIFTFVGLILIGYTLDQASRAAKIAVGVLKEAKSASDIARQGLHEAKLATDAANKSVEVTREIGTKQSRAYVSIESVDVAYALPSIMLSVVLKNYGNSPVISGYISGELELVLLPHDMNVDDKDLIVQIPYLMKRISFAVIEAGGISTISLSVNHLHIGWENHSPFDEETRSRILTEFSSPRTQWRFRLNVTWFDVFGQSQTLNATAANGSPSIGLDIIAGVGNSVTLNTHIHNYKNS